MNETKAWLPLVTQALPALPDHSVTSAGALTRRGTSKPKCESDGGKKKEILLRSLPSPRPTRTHAETSPGGWGEKGFELQAPTQQEPPDPGSRTGHLAWALVPSAANSHPTLSTRGRLRRTLRPLSSKNHTEHPLCARARVVSLCVCPCGLPWVAGASECARAS